MNISQFPEISKAAGAHKYLKRVPLAGGGYRYVYHNPKTFQSVGKVTAPLDLVTNQSQKEYVLGMVKARHAFAEIKGLTDHSIKLTKKGDKKAARAVLKKAEDRMKTWKETVNVKAGSLSSEIRANERGYLKNYFAGVESTIQGVIDKAKKTITIHNYASINRGA